MPTYPNTPGISVGVLEGGLRSAVTFKNTPTLVLATAAQGPAGVAVQVTDPSISAKVFGLEGTASRAMAEVLQHSDNVQIFRIGTKAATLAGIGATGANTGITLELGQRQANAGSIYKVWYSNGALYLWLNDNLVYALDTLNGVSEDSSDSLVEGSAIGGLNLCAELGVAFVDDHTYAIGDQVKPAAYNGLNFVCTVAGTSGAQEPAWNTVLGQTTVSGTATFKAVFPSQPTLANALTVTAAAAVVTQGALTSPVFTPAVDGTGLTARQTYVALADTLDLLSTQKVSQVYCPNALLDTPNVAFYVAADPTTSANNPATNPDALDWLKITTDAYGDRTYSWASESNANFASPADRLTQGYHEVNFGYLLSVFCANQQEELGGCIAFIGTKSPAFYNGKLNNRFDPLSTRKWVGNLPTYDYNGNPTSFGTGLCGIPYVVGTTAAKLHPLTVDYSSGFRLPGFFENDAQAYDGGANEDKNGTAIDIGQYLHIVYDYQQLGNSYATRYIGNLAGVVAGRAATLDKSQALTYKPLNGVTLVWAPNFAQMESLSTAKLNGLRGDESTAILLHDLTAALATSDWFTLYNVNLRFLLTNVAYTRGKTFLGTGALKGLQAQGLQTGLDGDASELQKRGYISSCSWTITTSAADARIGTANVDCSFSAPGQLRRLNFAVGITSSVNG